jgi:hypothetical protein
MNTSQENKRILENHKDKELEKSQTMLIQLKEAMNNHKYIGLPEILKEKQCISTRIGYFDIDYILDEETQVNILTQVKAYYGTFIAKDRLV